MAHKRLSVNSVQQWAEVALEWYSYELGYDSPEAGRMRFFSSELSNHPGWATREQVHIGGPDMILM